MNKSRVGFAMRIQRLEQRTVPVNGLQPVHPVSQAQRGIEPFATDIVPRPPGGAAARHQAHIGMQHGAVRLEAESRKNVMLRRCRIGNQGKGLVGMRRHYNAIKPDITLAGD